jgi:serine/threonine-protein kinase
MIVSLMSGLHYLHDRGIVHRELKPEDLIVESDGSLRICGYATSVLEEQRFVHASQVGGASYRAPEIWAGLQEGLKVRDQKTDVFSFGLILYEIVTGRKVFPLTMSAAVIMGRVMGARPEDRSEIPADVSPVIGDLISRSWVPTAQKRPSFEDLWKQMRDCECKLFPGVSISFVPAST